MTTRHQVYTSPAKLLANSILFGLRLRYTGKMVAAALLHLGRAKFYMYQLGAARIVHPGQLLEKMICKMSCAAST
eukprot:CAMPEP_0197640374 /NCGR_PEP_ID=MMETSP1338-20131121/14690_1 /TAXON_ID=43686 ORGANISM="Pelagodinium beii, Strain RCC1491" /NCGR_SAMPLE_ID=MMETSP1338 /ASSEMBLY_ACC=CAM_ASM_000754 /LENGTH=74 /DNA_ID=CAMNT_0043213219 /DNA_START=46 /DNA_END=267 /DNA_ORIENTATION=+